MAVELKPDLKQTSPATAAEISQVLEQFFGYTEFRPGQQEVIEHLLQGRSAAAVFPTGSGKSLCYQLPAILLPGLTMVVSPLIALMKDQIDALAQRKIPAARIDSTLSSDELRATWNAVRQGKLKLLYVAPERFTNERFREMLKETRVSLFAIDEAHCISEWGHNFRPDYLKLASFASLCGVERILALTATAPGPVLQDICREFNIEPACAIRTGFYRPNLTLQYSPVTQETRDQRLLAELQSQPPGATIVYVTLQKTTDDVASMLTNAGIPSRAYHAGMSADDRSAVQDWFLKAPHSVIVATIAFGMGIDKSDIRYVYHYNMPKSLENYSQEIGRAGRDGAPAYCHLLACPDDLRVLENFIYGDTPSFHAVQGLLTDIFAQGKSLRLNINALAQQYDIRDLVIRTLLTYLELDGTLLGGTPCYNEYKFQFIKAQAQILAQFKDERRLFLERLFKETRRAVKWNYIDVDRVAQVTRHDRERIVKALEYLHQKSWIKLETAGVVHRYEVQQRPLSLPRLADELHQRMVVREEREIRRLRSIPELVEHQGCQTARLAAHFGEILPAHCGHCSWCMSQGVPVQLPDRAATEIPASAWRAIGLIRHEHAQALPDHRAVARFLCGVPSPKQVRAKLGKHPWFGRFADVPFQRVLEALEQH